VRSTPGSFVTRVLARRVIADNYGRMTRPFLRGASARPQRIILSFASAALQASIQAVVDPLDRCTLARMFFARSRPPSDFARRFRTPSWPGEPTIFRRLLFRRRDIGPVRRFPYVIGKIRENFEERARVSSVSRRVRKKLAQLAWSRAFEVAFCRKIAFGKCNFSAKRAATSATMLSLLR